MIFKEIKHKEQWDEKIGSAKMSQFLQSWNWGELQRSLGRKVWHLNIHGDYLLVIKMKTKKSKNSKFNYSFFSPIIICIKFNIFFVLFSTFFKYIYCFFNTVFTEFMNVRPI